MTALRADACVIDLDGTITFGGRMIPGADVALRRIRAAGLPVLFATNTTRKPRRELVERLEAMGVEVHAEELFTAPVAAARWLRAHNARSVALFLADATHEEFSEFATTEPVDFVVVGDLGEAWSYDRLNHAFRLLKGGAGLVAIQKNRCWDPGDGMRLDAGPFVAALEYAAEVEAELIGKPSPDFYRTAVARLGAPAARVVVVGDVVDNDVRGGHAAGCQAVLVRTGSFRPEHLEAEDRAPDAVLGSIAELPEWLGLAGG